jgi:2'-5' RNA ligase
MSDSALIAYIPVDGSWCKQDFPHMTLVYAGLIVDRSETEFNALAKDAISAARVTGTFNLNVTSVDQMGEGIDKVDVLTLYPTPQLLLARNIVEKWDTGEFPNFIPHATIGPVGSAMTIADPAPQYSQSYMRQSLPTKIFFNRIAACWGDKRLIFNIDEMW